MDAFDVFKLASIRDDDGSLPHITAYNINIAANAEATTTINSHQLYLASYVSKSSCGTAHICQIITPGSKLILDSATIQSGNSSLQVSFVMTLKSSTTVTATTNTGVSSGSVMGSGLLGVD